MRSADWDAKIEAFWQANDDEEAFLRYAYHRDLRPRPTYVPHVWGCELEENRTFAFWVSDSRDLGAREPFEARFVGGEELGVEWDGALARFWRERERVEELRRVAGKVKGRFGRLAWLETQNAESDGKEGGGGEESDDSDWYYLGESSEEEYVDELDRERRDSGGGKEPQAKGGKKVDSSGKRK